MIVRTCLSDEELTGALPDEHACCGADVERMFGAVLGYLYAGVGGVDDFLLYSLDFIAEDDGKSLSHGAEVEMLEEGGAFALLDAEHGVAC